MDLANYYDRIRLALTENHPLWQVTIIETSGSSPAKAGMKACIGTGELYFGNLGGGELEYGLIRQIRSELPERPVVWSFSLTGTRADIYETDQRIGMICGGAVKVFIEPLYKADTLYIIGAGHCGRALSSLARSAGFFTCLIDNREELLKQAEHEGLADSYCYSDYTGIGTLIRDTHRAWVVIMTHGHLHDREVLEQCLRLDLPYLGMIGSKSKVAETFETLRNKGLSPDQLESVHAPIGLPIGSQTPVEIAISIMAEIIQIRKQNIR